MKKLVFLVCLLAGFVLTANAIRVVYTADNKTIFKNPERGFTEELSKIVSTAKPNVVKGNVSSSWGSNYKMSMPMVLYNFNKFKAQDLPDEILAGFDEDMGVLRSNGLKCVLRFAYTEIESDKIDATPDWVERHLAQLKPYLKKNADVIYVLEAGFVGVWGEWYYTTNYSNESQHMNKNRRRVVEALFANAPEDRFVLFRYPMLKTEYFSNSNPLSDAEGFNGSMKSRWGCHNDAFLNDWGNDGTYASNSKSDDPAVRQFIAQETLYVPNGGETNVESETAAEKVYKDGPSEMSTYHWSFCGSSYAAAVTNRWKNSGLFDTLNIHMGYRYNLLQAEFSDQAAPGGKANVAIELKNVGYAPLYNKRTAYLVLKSSSKTYTIALQTDPRRWLPNNAWSAIREQVSIPSNVAEGTYHLYLWLPDQYESIKNDSRYAIRFANTNVWDSSTGYNDLKASINISNSTPKDPGALPQSIDETKEQANNQPQKIIENGIFYILYPDGTKYTILGQK